MPNEKKHDSGASEGGRRPTEDASESSANVGGGRWSAKKGCGENWRSKTAFWMPPILRLSLSIPCHWRPFLDSIRTPATNFWTPQKR